MKKQVSLWGGGALLAVLTLVLLWVLPALAAHHLKAADAAKNVYICGCGPACGCDMVADQPGKCPCGKDLIEKPVVREDADKVYVCACPDNCKCSVNAADPGKCACGKDLRAYPKGGKKIGCAHGPGGCDKPCGEKMAAGCDKPCGEKMAAGCDKPCGEKMAAGCDKPCCAKAPEAAK